MSSHGVDDRDTSSTWYLRILKPPSPSTLGVPPSLSLHPNQSQHYVILSGTLEELEPYAGSTVDWLLSIARLAFGPYTPGMLRCHRDDRTTYWKNHVLVANEWEEVELGDTMKAKVYEFTPTQEQDSEVERRYLRNTLSRTGSSIGSTSKQSRFRREAVDRDDSCPISGFDDELCAASHLIPVRLGRDGVQQIIRRYQPQTTEPSDWASYDIYDARLGILMGGPFNLAVDGFKLGFKATVSCFSLLLLHYCGVPTYCCPLGNRKRLHDPRIFQERS